MKHIVITILIFIISLFPIYSVAQEELGCGEYSIQFPGENNEYMLGIYRDHITIYGPDLPKFVYENGVEHYFIQAYAHTSEEIARMNTWLATLLQAKVTRIPVTVRWASNDPNDPECIQYGNVHGIGNVGHRAIVAIEF